MKTPRIELVYFEGCPNASQARDNLREAVEASGQGVTFTSSPFTKTVGDRSALRTLRRLLASLARRRRDPRGQGRR